MASLLPPRYNWGTEVKNINATLYNQLQDAYTTTARVVNTKINGNTAITDPPADDPINMNFKVTDIWVNSLTNNAWIMTSRTTNTAVNWQKIT